MNYFIHRPDTDQQLGFHFDPTNEIEVYWESNQMESQMFDDGEIDEILLISKTGMYFEGSVSHRVKPVVDYIFKNTDIDFFCVRVDFNPAYMAVVERSDVQF